MKTRTLITAVVTLLACLFFSGSALAQVHEVSNLGGVSTVDFSDLAIIGGWVCAAFVSVSIADRLSAKA